MVAKRIIVGKVCELNSETIGSSNPPQMIRYLDTGSITKNKIENIQLLDSRIEPFPSRAQRKVKKGTIIYSTVRPIQEHFGYLENPEENFIVSTGFLTLDVVDKELDPKFFYYCLTRKDLTNYLHNIAVNNVSSYPSINPDDLGSLELEIPADKKVQQKIAAVLSSLDAKIELNNRINVELEALAKTLYDYWFVQFDFPFDPSASSGHRFAQGKPAEHGQPYKSSGGKMVWNEALKREIPAGWEVGELSDIANITMGQSPPGKSYNEEGEGMIFFQGCTDFGNRFPTVRQFTTQPTRYAKEGDILLSVRAPVGTINIAKENCCIGRGLAALNSKDNCIAYIFGVMVNLKQIFDRRNVDGTTFGSITKNDLYSLKVMRPDKKILEQYQKAINPAFEKQNKIELENQTLAELRDWLLPLLMNGQVTVR